MSSGPQATGGRFERVQQELCALLRVDSSGRLLFTPGCTAALALALALDDLPWEPGDAVLTSAMEHHALIRPVQRLDLELARSLLRVGGYARRV